MVSSGRSAWPCRRRTPSTDEKNSGDLWRDFTHREHGGPLTAQATRSPERVGRRPVIGSAAAATGRPADGWRATPGARAVRTAGGAFQGANGESTDRFAGSSSGRSRPSTWELNPSRIDYQRRSVSQRRCTRPRSDAELCLKWSCRLERFGANGRMGRSEPAAGTGSRRLRPAASRRSRPETRPADFRLWDSGPGVWVPADLALAVAGG